MYHLLKGLHEYLTRKDEFSVIIIGLDGAGKTTLLEKIKTMYNDTPGLPPDKIAPTVGQNTGKIALPSALLQFWDLGGQRGIRLHMAKVLRRLPRRRLRRRCGRPRSASARAGKPSTRSCRRRRSSVFRCSCSPTSRIVPTRSPLRRSETTTKVWYQHKIESARRRQGSEHDNEQQRERIASLDVMGLSALNGTGVRAIVDWVFIRVQNSKRRDESS
ncbi:P-loop containing nucleoside triphosphate hydrolase protein [Lactarius indigo]|nr:P-loop containing nucleoside triphosphate hydrolase protein [Lactarius indigo]